MTSTFLWPPMENFVNQSAISITCLSLQFVFSKFLGFALLFLSLLLKLLSKIIIYLCTLLFKLNPDGWLFLLKFYLPWFL